MIVHAFAYGRQNMGPIERLVDGLCFRRQFNRRPWHPIDAVGSFLGNDRAGTLGV
jgi:hypothetical protein